MAFFLAANTILLLSNNIISFNGNIDTTEGNSCSLLPYKEESNAIRFELVDIRFERQNTKRAFLFYYFLPTRNRQLMDQTTKANMHRS
jgi:hypothetical protein